MTKLERVSAHGRHYGWMFWCPGCGIYHVLDDRWQFDGDEESPTFFPSLVTRGEKRCHLFLRAGQIQYLDDCDHDLAGQTVPLAEEPPLTS